MNIIIIFLQTVNEHLAIYVWKVTSDALTNSWLDFIVVIVGQVNSLVI